jgi:hypothetical protein
VSWVKINQGWLKAKRLGQHTVVAGHVHLLDWRLGPVVRVDSSYVHVSLHLLPIEVSVSWRRRKGVAAWIDRMQRA